MRHRTSPLIPLTVFLACGDAGSDDGSLSHTGSGLSTAATTEATASAATSNTESGSSTTSSSSSSSSSTTMTSDETSTSDVTTSDTTGTVDCEDMPPQGYMVDPDESCTLDPAVGQFTPTTLWHINQWKTDKDSNRITSAPVVVRLNDDPYPEIVVITYNDCASPTMRIVSGNDGAELKDISDANVYCESGVAAADLDLDGNPEIIALTALDEVVAIDPFGGVKWTSVPLTGHIARNNATPSVANVDGQGPPEIIVGRAILNADGTIRGTGDHGTGAVVQGDSSFAVDLDQDGEMEIVVGNALYTADGGTIWYNQEPDGRPAVADLDLDGAPDIIVVSDGEIRRQDADTGAVVWSKAVPGGGNGPPTIADFDGDTYPEIGVAGGDTYSVFQGDGSILWQKPTQDGSKFTGSTVFDFEGDGAAEVLYADENDLWVFAGADGTTRLQFSEHQNSTSMEYPVVADVDADGHADIVLVSDRRLQEPTSNSGIYVISDAATSWAPVRSIWNQHAYHITNTEEDGTIPTIADPSWTSYNSFRAGQMALPDGPAAPDLVVVTPESCVTTCDGTDKITIWIQLGNIGAAPISSSVKVNLDLKGGNPDQYSQTLENVILAAGEYGNALAIKDVPITGVSEINLSASPLEAECKVDEGNTITLKPPFCTPPG